MKHIIRRDLTTRLPRPVVGCALQGDKFLAMAVSGSRDGWTIHWYRAGTLGNEERLAELVAAVGRTPFWVVPRKEGAAQRDFAFAADIPEEIARAERERAAALRTQVETRFANVAQAVEAGGVDVRGPSGRHLVAFGAIRPAVDDDLRYWRRQRHIREPHVAAPAAAIANLYVACCPPDLAGDKMRLVIVQGRVTTTAVVMDGWKLVDAVEYQMLEGQTLDALLVQDWVDYVRQRHPSQRIAPEPLVVSAAPVAGFATWNPFAADGPVSAASPETIEELCGEMGFSAIAFGMALQGGN